MGKKEGDALPFGKGRPSSAVPFFRALDWKRKNRSSLRRQKITGGILLGKLTLGKILSEILGQYFYQGFKPRDRIFPAVFKKSPISSGHRLKI